MNTDTGPPEIAGTLPALCEAALQALASEAESLERIIATPGADPDVIRREANARVTANWSTHSGLLLFARGLATLPASETAYAVKWGLSEENLELIALGRTYATQFDPSKRMTGQDLV